MDCKRLDEMLNNLYLFHQFLKKTGFNYENFNGPRKITFNHHLTLMLLKKDGKLSMSEIRELIGITKQNMNYIIDNLVGSGLVKRTPDMKDRRVVRVFITEEGNEYLVRWQENKIEEMKRIFASYDDEDLEKLYNSIETINNILIKNDGLNVKIPVKSS
jgi:DNA-binding MarR family transcriptional regulator